MGDIDSYDKIEKQEIGMVKELEHEYFDRQILI